MRLDVYLSENLLAKSRSYAGELIRKGLVAVDGKTVTKPSFNVENENVEVIGEVHSFVGRGGVKLDGALEKFGIDVTGYTAIDIGASTGGFTDCLLKRGAEKVYAVDSGHGQLAESLMSDPRVVNIEGFNARELSPVIIPEKCDIAVCDVSFISQTYVIGPMVSVLADDGIFVTLIKPQFECGREAIGKGGIVKDKKYYREAAKKVIDSAERFGLICTDIALSPVKGGDGNTEFVALFVHSSDEGVSEEYIKEVTGCSRE